MPRSRPALVCALVAALALPACGGGGDDGGTRYDEPDAPFTFSYPETMSEVTIEASEIKGREPDARVAVGLDPQNAVTVATYTLAQPVEQYDQDTFLQTLDRTVRAIARPQKLKPGERTAAKVGDLDGWRYDLSDTDGVVQRLLFAFRGTDQVFIRCSWEQDADLAKQVGAACDEVAASIDLR